MAELPLEMEFVVKTHDWHSEAGKTPTYKVTMKRGKQSVTLLSDDRSILQLFPKNETVVIKIAKAQTNLELPTEE